MKQIGQASKASVIALIVAAAAAIGLLLAARPLLLQWVTGR